MCLYIEKWWLSNFHYISDGLITLFSPHDVPGLHDAFGLPEFDEIYKNYEEF